MTVERISAAENQAPIVKWQLPREVRDNPIKMSDSQLGCNSVTAAPVRHLSPDGLLVKGRSKRAGKHPQLQEHH